MLKRSAFRFLYQHSLASLPFFWVGLLGFFSLNIIATDASAAGRPNIVFIMADDLGYGHLGCYGQEKIRTPNIDKLAAEGMRFTQWYAGCTVCAPSRSTLMTGLHTGHTPVRVNGGGYPIRPEDVTVAEVLKGVGYATGMFGKWGLGDIGTTGMPDKQGFDEFFGYLHQVHAHFYYPYFLYKNDQQFFLPENDGEKRVRYSHDEIATQALKFLRNHKDGPFFLYVPFTTPHTELLVPEDSLAEYRGKFPETPHVSKSHYAPQPTPRAAFAAMITRMDRSVGEIMALLKEFKLDDNTIVFFTSDNGGQNVDGPDVPFFKGNGPLRGAKGILYEGGIRDPMIVRWPGKIAAGKVTDHVAAHWDIMPTLAEIAGTKPPENLDGISIVPTLFGAQAAGRAQPAHEFLYWEHPAARQLTQAARMGDWKGYRTGPDQPLELYNLKSDIGETKNVAAENPAVVARIKTYLKTARTEARPPLAAPQRGKPDYVR